MGKRSRKTSTKNNGKKKANKINESKTNDFVVALIPWRGMAAIIDTFIVLGIYYPFMIITGVVFGDTWINFVFTSNFGLVIFLLYYLFTIGLLEVITHGGIGKKTLKLEVVSLADGTLATRQQLVTRNVCRLVDLLPIVVPYIAGIVLAVSSKEDKRQRFGDTAAGTIVTAKVATRGQVIKIKKEVVN